MGVPFRSSGASAEAGRKRRLSLRTSPLFGRTERVFFARTAADLGRAFAAGASLGRRPGRIAATGAGLFRGTALGRGAAGCARGATVVCGLEPRGARRAAGGGGGGGGGGGATRGRGFGRFGFGSGFGAGCGSGLGEGVVAGVGVGSVGTSDGDASPASACEDAKPKLEIARTTVASLMRRGRREAAAGGPFISLELVHAR